MLKIAPSLLSADFGALKEETVCIENAGADYLHIDVMDGMFVPNISFGFPIIEAIRPVSGLHFDVHLMIEEPERYLSRFVEAGADLITVHYEAVKDMDVALDTIRLSGKRVGLSIKPNTPVEVLYPYLDKLDLVLIMTVEPGFGGQKLIPHTVEKIRALRLEMDKRQLNVEIEADGGINQENAPLLVEAGVDVIVAGSSVFGAKDRKAAIEALKKANR